MAIRRYLSRFWKYISGSRAPQQRKSVRCRPELECLEDRRLMTTNVYLDFGLGFPMGGLTVRESDMNRNDINGPTKIDHDDDEATARVSLFGNGYTLISLTQSLQNRMINVDSDPVIDARDGQVLASQVIAVVQRSFEPFDVNILQRNAASIDDVAATLASSSSRDAYVFVAGAVPAVAAGKLVGIAPVDFNNGKDNTGFAFADRLISLYPASMATALARVAAHEAAHTFGLAHTNASMLIASGDEMGAPQTTSDMRRYDTVNLFSRFDLQLLDDATRTQNAYEILAQSKILGLKANAPAYVTGTGAFDQITITRSGVSGANVFIQSFSDAGFTNQIGSDAYGVSTLNGITVEAGVSNDRIILDAALGTTVTVRGGIDTDLLTVNGTSSSEYFTVTRDQVRVGVTVINFAEMENFTINAGLGSDALALDDRLNPNGGSYFVGNGGAGSWGNPVTYSGIENLNLLTSNQGSGVDVIAAATGVTVTVTGGPQNDHVLVWTNTFAGGLTVHGGAGGNDTLELYDRTNASPGWYVVANGVAGRFGAGINHSGIENLTLYTTNQGSDVDLFSGEANTAVTVRGGLGSDRVTVYPVNFLGSLTVDGDGGAGSDSLVVDDRANPALGSYDVQGWSVGRWNRPFSYSGLETVKLYTSNVASLTDVGGTLATTPVTIEGGNGWDIVTLGAEFETLKYINGGITFNGNAGTDDRLVLIDRANDVTSSYFGGVRLYTVKDTSVSAYGSGLISFNTTASPTVEKIELTTSALADWITIQSTKAGVSMTIDAKAGNDKIEVGVGNLDNIKGALIVAGGVGSDDRLLLTDQNNPYVLSSLGGTRFYSVDETSVSAQGAALISFNTGSTTVEKLELTTGKSTDWITVYSTKSGASMTINADEGNDRIDAGYANMDSLRGSLTVNGGGGSNTLNLLDQSNFSAGVYTIRNTTVERLFAAKTTYSGIENLNLSVSHKGSGTDIVSTLSTTTVTVNGGNGADRFSVGASTYNLDNIPGPVTVNGNGGIGDSLYIYDQLTTRGQSYYLDGDTFVRPFLYPVTYGTLEKVEINTSSFDDSITLWTATFPIPVTINAGGGANDSLSGANAVNNWQIIGLNTGKLNNALTFNAVESLFGGNTTDTFLFNNGARLDGSINGTSGVDTLDYSAYATAVAVNLQNRSATGVGGGAASKAIAIENVTGGSNNDILIGDGLVNTLLGNGGHDILVGGAANDRLYGGLGRDLVIGGLGLDFVEGNDEDDIMIGGATSWDANNTALTAILNEWKRTDLSRQQRIDHLSGKVGGGLNGSYLLNSATVTDDAVRDMLVVQGLDWILAGLGDDMPVW